MQRTSYLWGQVGHTDEWETRSVGCWTRSRFGHLTGLLTRVVVSDHSSVTPTIAHTADPLDRTSAPRPLWWPGYEQEGVL